MMKQQVLGTSFAHKRSIQQAGYSLLELMIVLVIIGLLGALVGPSLMGNLDKSKVQTCETQVRQIKASLDVFRLDLGRYPMPEEGLNILITQPNEEPLRSRWRGPYLEPAQVPLDPWGYPYIYGTTSKPNQPFALYSNGPTGRPGGQGQNAPVGMLP
jgi:general secretion pathway protein G